MRARLFSGLRPAPSGTARVRLVIAAALCLLLVGVAACSSDTLRIELTHPAGFDPAAQRGNLELLLIEIESGKQVHKATTSLERLGSEQLIGESLDLVVGRSYRLILRATLQSSGCNTAESKNTAVGISPPFTHAEGGSRLTVYIDCAGRSSPTGAPTEARFFHSATPLAGQTPPGVVLIAGGIELADPADFLELEKGRPQDSLELYDPEVGSFRRLEARLSRSRLWHQATRVGPNQIVVTGGGTVVESAGKRRFVVLDLVELIDGQRLTQLPPLSRPRSGHLALLVGDRVLVAGGVTRKELASSSAELYDVASGLSLGPIANMGARRVFPMAAAVGASAFALIAGGAWFPGIKFREDLFCLSGNDCGCSAPCFQPVEGYPRAEGRSSGAAVSVQCADGADGSVYVIGGRHEGAQPEVYDDIYCYDRKADGKAMHRIGKLTEPRGTFTATLVRPAGGGAPRIFVAGGANDSGLLRTAELFSAPCRCPKALAASEPRSIPLTTARFAHTASALADGSVLLVGGLTAERTAERFMPGL